MLDATLGDGATRAFEQAVSIDDIVPAVFYSTWTYSPPVENRIVVSGSVVTNYTPNEDPWPGHGEWLHATVIWPDQVSQQVFFQDKKIHWGVGLCLENGGENGDSLKRLASQPMKQFLATYVDEMKVQFPNVSNFYSRFLLAGFEIVSQTENTVVIGATLKDPNSKMAQLFNWRINGAAPEDEPAWRTQVRQEIGLDTLFPNE